MKRTVLISILVLLLGLSGFYFTKEKEPIDIFQDSNILSYVINPQKQELKFYWKDKEDKNYINFQNLKDSLHKENQELVFAMNGGMYNKDLSPQGLYIENGKILAPTDRREKGYGNFYLQPNGIFFLTKENKAIVCTTDKFINDANVKYATQSGPMLLIEGKIHPKFNKGSANLHIRNGVGILPNGDILFAMSKQKINFFDFASFFKQNNCKNALYLDGFVSKTYLPIANWKQLNGKFGVIIAEIKK